MLDADAALAASMKAGAREGTASTDNAFGGRNRDPFGTIWWITANVETVTSEAGMRHLDEPEYHDRIRSAQQSLDAELGGHGDASPVARQ